MLKRTAAYVAQLPHPPPPLPLSHETRQLNRAPHSIPFAFILPPQPVSAYSTVYPHFNAPRPTFNHRVCLSKVCAHVKSLTSEKCQPTEGEGRQEDGKFPSENQQNRQIKLRFRNEFICQRCRDFPEKTPRIHQKQNEGNAAQHTCSTNTYQGTSTTQDMIECFLEAPKSQFNFFWWCGKGFSLTGS